MMIFPAAICEFLGKCACKIQLIYPKTRVLQMHLCMCLLKFTDFRCRTRVNMKGKSILNV